MSRRDVSTLFNGRYCNRKRDLTFYDQTGQLKKSIAVRMDDRPKYFKSLPKINTVLN